MEDHADVRVPPLVIFVAPLLLGLFCGSRWPWQMPLSARYKVVSAAILLTGAVTLAVWAIATFRRRRTTIWPMGSTRAVVAQGPYKYSRNPMYLAMTLAYVGVCLGFDSVWPLVFLPGVLLVVDSYVIRREESYLRRKFGRPYLQYAARVRRWF